jgi:hypothetical protein
MQTESPRSSNPLFLSPPHKDIPNGRKPSEHAPVCTVGGIDLATVAPRTAGDLGDNVGVRRGLHHRTEGRARRGWRAEGGARRGRRAEQGEDGGRSKERTEGGAKARSRVPDSSTVGTRSSSRYMHLCPLVLCAFWLHMG